MADNWQKIGQSQLTNTNNTKRFNVYVAPPKKENIIIIGSEMQYDSFWLKMMFISAATLFVNRPMFRKCDKVTIAYVNIGYTIGERLAIENIPNFFYSACNNVHFKKILSMENIISLINNDRDNFKIQDLVFFCHGLNGEINLNYNKKPDINIKSIHLNQIKSDAFLHDGKIYSYACRTGISDSPILRLKDDYSNIDEAKPKESLAQKMADYFNIEVHAFYKRTFYGNVLRNKSDDTLIVRSLNQKKSQNPNAQILVLTNDYEAIKHDGLGGLGALREGTKGYALWRRGGGRVLPTAADTPRGLPDNMMVFRKQ